MDNNQTESISVAFSRCMTQLSRTIKSYVASPPIPSPAEMGLLINGIAPYPRAAEITRDNCNQIYASMSAPNSHSQEEDMITLNESDDDFDTKSVVTVVKYVEPRPINEASQPTSISSSSSATYELTPPQQCNMDLRGNTTFANTSVKDKLQQLMFNMLSSNDAITPIATPLGEWIADVSDSDVQDILQWRYHHIVGQMRHIGMPTVQCAKAFPKVFIHTQSRYTDVALAMATIGGMTMLLRSAHNITSPQQMFHILMNEAKQLDEHLFDCMNRARVANYVVVGQPPDNVPPDAYFKSCIGITARAIYGVAYTMSGMIGVRNIDNWLKCSDCYNLKLLNDSNI